MSDEGYTLDPDALPVEQWAAEDPDEPFPEAADGQTAIIMYGHRVERHELPSSTNKYIDWMEQNPPWKVEWQQSVTDHGDEFYADKNRRTEVKVPGHYQEHVWLRGYLISEAQSEPLYVARFTMEWKVKIHPVTDKRTNTFVNAIFWDMITEEQRYEKQLGPFQIWLGALAPVGKILPQEPRKKKKPGTMTIQEELEKGEWNG